MLFDVLATNASTEQSHREEKRFSQFAWLHKRLSKELSKSNSAAAGMLPALPSKTVSVASNFSSVFFFVCRSQNSLPTDDITHRSKVH